MALLSSPGGADATELEIDEGIERDIPTDVRARGIERMHD